MDKLQKSMYGFSQRIYTQQAQQDQYQQAADQAQKAAQGFPGGDQAKPQDVGAGGAKYTKKAEDEKKEDKKKVVDVEWDEEDEDK